MTGVQQMLVGGSGFTVPSDVVNYSPSNTDVGGGAVAVNFLSDGTLTYTLDASLQNGTWGIGAPSAGVGSLYWIQFGAKTGAGVLTPTTPTGILSLSAGQFIQLTGAPTPGSRVASCPYTIFADAAGTQPRRTGTLSFSSFNS